MHGGTGDACPDGDEVVDDLVGHVAEQPGADDGEDGADGGENNGEDEGDSVWFKGVQEFFEGNGEVFGFVGAEVDGAVAEAGFCSWFLWGLVVHDFTPLGLSGVLALAISSSAASSDSES